jgi:hypothetical protein
MMGWKLTEGGTAKGLPADLVRDVDIVPLLIFKRGRGD